MNYCIIMLIIKLLYHYVQSLDLVEAQAAPGAMAVVSRHYREDGRQRKLNDV